MIQTSPHAISPTPQELPVALIYSSQLMLTEKSSIGDDMSSFAPRRETLTIRATHVTSILKGIPGYRHGGINE
jgi:hypothetical protein